jgi:tetratricopeptide (TPR) repeat protein
MGYAFDLAGEADSAIVYYERFLEHKLTDIEVDPPALSAVYKRLAELHDAAGNHDRAISNYQAFVELWKNADPELQPTVQRARTRAAELARRRG